ncbi:GLUG motif-containing protein, partial [Syntrophomonas palmitatica]|uniref:GLUG motif-containing protein n=1 Tax=Syntrophomonas palmitatica TaxID=402877 RepID=UPI00242028A2
ESSDTYTVMLTARIPISTKEELDAVRNNLPGHYILLNDIDLGGANWEPYGSFSGSFDANGHTIYNFNINKSSSNNVGFFSVIEAGAEVKNLTLKNYVVTGREYVGGLAGKNFGRITGCSAEGSVAGSYHQVGGLAGYNEGTIENSHATGSVTGEGSNNVGGLVGYNKGGTITGCYATGDVYSQWVRVGGLAGLNENGKITASYAAGNVSSKDNSLGGLAGANSGIGTIADCYATGSVTNQNAAKSSIGGLVGENSGTASITNCYAIGAVSGGANYMGGLVGKNSSSGSISRSYYNTETCGAGADNGIGTGKTTTELKQQATFAGWNFING